MGARDKQDDDLELARAMLDRLTELFDDPLTPAHVVEKLPGRVKELRSDIRALEALAAEAAKPVPIRGELPSASSNAALFRSIMGEVENG